MARRVDHERAIALRKEGRSYSEIKEVLCISKSTLSNWLREYPLSKKQLRELRDVNPIRIEKFRSTMQRKKDERLATAYGKAKQSIGNLSSRDLLIGGLFLYWGEGGKTTPYSASLSNTDPAILVCFIKWLSLLGVSKDRLKVRLHLYSDMDIKKEINFWAQSLRVSSAQFNKPQIKQSKLSELTYPTRGHGTCLVTLHDRDISEYIRMGLKYIQSQYMRP
jgi:transposase-like protein